MALDPAAEEYLQRLLADAPPLPDLVCGLLVRDFTTKTPADATSTEAA